MAKSCPISQRQFIENAQPAWIGVDGNSILAESNEFTFDWPLTGKALAQVADVSYNVQIGMNLTVIDRKNGRSE